MGMNREKGGNRGKFGGTEKRGWKLQTDNLKFKLFAQKNLNITLFCKEI